MRDCKGSPAHAWAAALLFAACGGAGAAPQSPATSGAPGYESEYSEPAPAAPAPTPPAATPPPAPPTAAPAAPVGPARERAAQLREAADLLDKAEAARERDAKSFAEQLFSSAELIVGAEALAQLAPRFREGAPPRVNTPVKPVPK